MKPWDATGRRRVSPLNDNFNEVVLLAVGARVGVIGVIVAVESVDNMVDKVGSGISGQINAKPRCLEFNKIVKWLVDGIIQLQ